MFSRSKTALEAIPEGCNLTGKTAIVTGGNSGIGVETVRALTSVGADVILCSRNVTEGERVAAELKEDSRVKGSITVKQLDLADFSSVKAFVDALPAAANLDYIILNAGVMAPPLLRTKEGFELQFGTNHVGHHYLTKLLLPRLKAQPKTTPVSIVAVASEGHRMGSINLQDPNYNERKYSKWPAYGQSKLANILFAKELAKRMEAEGYSNITAYSLHPGVIATNLSRHMGFGKHIISALSKVLLINIEQGASTTITAALADDLPRGAYLKGCAVGTPSAAGQDMEMASKLWEKTEGLIENALKAAS